jgi:hypothetical protein
MSRRNLLALLSKLDRQAAGEQTECTILNYQNASSAYWQRMKTLRVVAVNDQEFYGAQERAAGVMQPSDEATLPKPARGVISPGVF